MVMNMRDLFHTILNHVPWREEQELVDARAAVDQEYPPPSAEPEAEARTTSAGVKNSDGSAYNTYNTEGFHGSSDNPAKPAE